MTFKERVRKLAQEKGRRIGILSSPTSTALSNPRVESLLQSSSLPLEPLESPESATKLVVEEGGLGAIVSDSHTAPEILAKFDVEPLGEDVLLLEDRPIVLAPSGKVPPQRRVDSILEGLEISRRLGEGGRVALVGDYEPDESLRAHLQREGIEVENLGPFLDQALSRDDVISFPHGILGSSWLRTLLSTEVATHLGTLLSLHPIPLLVVGEETDLEGATLLALALSP